jgi:hypothetical protein
MDTFSLNILDLQLIVHGEPIDAEPLDEED